MPEPYGPRPISGRTVIGCALPEASRALYSGCAVPLESYATCQLLLLVEDRSNFHMLPYRSPAYAYSTMRSLLMSTSAGVLRPLSQVTPVGACAVPTPVSSLRIRAPVSISTMYRTALPVALAVPSAVRLLYPLPNTAAQRPSRSLTMEGWLNVRPRSASLASVNSHITALAGLEASVLGSVMLSA